MLVIKGVVGSLFQTAKIGALILLPAWTWQWTEANQFLICYAILSMFSAVFLALKAPASLEARMEMPMNETQPLSDRIATGFLLAFLLGWFLFIPMIIGCGFIIKPNTDLFHLASIFAILSACSASLAYIMIKLIYQYPDYIFLVISSQ